jgi:hypothetical protein
MPTSTAANPTDQLLAALDKQAYSHELRVGIDYYDNKLWYGLDVSGEGFFVTSGHTAIAAKGLSPGLTVNATAFPKSPMSPEGIKRYLDKTTIDGSALLCELEQFFARHAKFQIETTPFLLAHWVLGSYLYEAFPTYAYLWINSIQKGCGKTRVMELLGSVAFRSDGISVNPSAAVIYRTLDQVGAVLLTDEFEQSMDDDKKALITVLNAGFRRGAIVSRCGQNNTIEQFNTYCPKVFAGLNHLPDTLESRTIPIFMFPKAKKDCIQPFSSVHMEGALQGYRDDCGIWALENARQCSELVMKPDNLV